YYRFKFNTIVLEKGASSSYLGTGFVRTKIEDWENAEATALKYPVHLIARFSPNSYAILEVESNRDLQILETVYSQSVLLGDHGPKGWDIKYAQGDFNMTSDSALFPPLPKWEAQGYRADEYSRWLKGNWRPIEELYVELGVKPFAFGESLC